MLTRRGWTLLGAAAGLYLSARVVGLGQLDVLAVSATVLIGSSVVLAGLRPVDVSIRREVPERLTVGSEGRVDLVVEAQRRSPTLLVTDHFDERRRAARFRVAPLRVGQEARGAYRIPTERRGRYELGPLTLGVEDPFGLVRRTRVGAGIEEVLVFCRTHDIVAPPEAAGYDLDLDTRRHPREHALGTDFVGLREYEIGDDLRRVHWKSTARRDELMIRQDETRRRAPTIVLLDCRATAHDDASFERAVEAAASVVLSLERVRRECLLVDSTGRRIGEPGRRYFESVMDHLAVIAADGPPGFAPSLARREASLLVAIVGRTGGTDHRSIRAMTSGAGRTIVVDTVGRQDGRHKAQIGRDLVPAHVDGTFAPSWNEMVLRWHGRATRRSPQSLSAV